MKILTVYAEQVLILIFEFFFNFYETFKNVEYEVLSEPPGELDKFSEEVGTELYEVIVHVHWDVSWVFNNW